MSAPASRTKKSGRNVLQPAFPQALNRFLSFAEFESYREPMPYVRWSGLTAVTSSKLIVGYQTVVVAIPIANVATKALAIEAIPLSMFLSFLAGLAFFVAVAVVHLRCPPIARHDYTFATFERERRNWQFLLQNTRDTYLLLAAHNPRRGAHFLRAIAFGNNFIANVEEAGEALEKLLANDRKVARRDLWAWIQSVQWDNDNLIDPFWTIKWFADTAKPRSRILAFGCVALGFSMIAFTLVINAVDLLPAALHQVREFWSG